MKFFTKEVKIALTAILGIVVLFYGLQFLKGLTIFSNDDSYYVTFTDVSGLSSSSPVYANGYKVGVVKDIIYDYSPQGKIVAVTGTNGKTTTTALTGALMKLKYDNTLVGGNIGIPYTQICLDSTDDGVTVAEMSSFQLDTALSSNAAATVMVLNVEPGSYVSDMQKFLHILYSSAVL